MHKFPYTRVRLDPTVDRSRPILKGENTLWEPLLRVRLGIPKGKRSPRFPAYVDSGSPWCLFKADIGDYLGLDVESGDKDEIGGIIAGTPEPVYFHRVTLFVEDLGTIPIRAGFVRKLSTHGILGRDGFFDWYHIGFDQSEKPPLVLVDRIEKPS